MKQLFYIVLISIVVYSCGTTTKIVDTKHTSDEEAVVISNDSLEYEINIYDIGFSTYLHSIAKPMNFHSQDYLEAKNNFYVVEWNIRANNPLRYGDLYGNKIDYSTHLDYGLEVNYKLYNYFKFFEKKYGVRLR